MKRNAERYKFWEPRPPVDAVWARIRKSQFSLCKVQGNLNFLVTFAKNALLGPKSRFGTYFSIFGPKSRFLGPKRTYGPQIDFWPKRLPFWLKFHWFYKHPRHGGTKTHFCTKINFYTKNQFLPPELYYCPKIDF